MKTVWFNGLDKDQAAEFKKILLANQTYRIQFLKILRDRYEMIERKGFKEDDYKTTDWVMLQAFNNGRLSVLKEIADLFNFEGDSKANDQ